MTNFNIATGEEQPLNRTGFENVQLEGENQGVPVGIDNSGTEPKLVRADAAADANEAGDAPVTAVGVLFPREVLPEGKYGGVNTHPWDDVEAQIYEETRTKAGDRATAVRSGIEMVNDDGDTSFPVLNGQADRFELVINASVVEDNGEGLGTGDSVELEITSRSGGSTQVIFTMPQQLAGQTDNDPVPL